ncbi:MAG: lactonase family protein [Planctomycetes bacterium]|nr:lactonase family protein [Planctomycetota bacterium]
MRALQNGGKRSATRQVRWLLGAVVVGIVVAGVPVQAAGQATQRAVFVVNNVSDAITSFTVNADGTLNRVGAYVTSDWPTPIAVAPSGEHLAVAHATSALTEILSVFAVNADASLAAAASTMIGDAPLSLVWLNDDALAVTESAYGGSSVHVYAYDAQLGTLTHIDQETTGVFNTSLALGKNGAYLYAQDSSGYTIRWFAVQPDGTLDYAGAVGTGGIYALDLVITPDGSKLYAGGGISGDGHRILGYAIDKTVGTLTVLPGSPYQSAGQSPAYTAVSTDGAWLFVGHGTDATVRTFAIGPDGGLTPTGFFFDVGMQGTCGDLATLAGLLLVTDESTALDDITGLYSFDIGIDGSFVAVDDIYDTLGTRPESIATWVPAPLLGDMNCDGRLDGFDIDPFVVAMTDVADYEELYPGCDVSHADINGDGLVNGFDIDPFVDLLEG